MNVLSLDVAIGAVVSSLFFSEIFDVAISHNTLTALAITVWIIYTLDHLRDAKIIPKPAATVRHSFHQNNFRVLIAIVFAFLVLDMIIVFFFIPHVVIVYGFCLGLLVLLYLVFQHNFKFLKEFFVACLYTSGIILPSVAGHGLEVPAVTYIFIGQFCLTALVNLLLFSLFDFEQDRHHEQNSFVTWFGRESTRRLIWALITINISASLFLFVLDNKAAIIFILMNAVLLSILCFERSLRANNYYRMIGDAIFFVPMLYFL
jgi:4-hydroxybenzoate polyprenyltransferase